MIQSLINKLELNNNCELNMEELKQLYYIDNKYIKELEKYRVKRDIYKDFVKLFGSKYVACKKEEINENTICYVGSLSIDKRMPTYNLKYIHGSLIYRLNKIYNLENLEIVYKVACFNDVHEFEGLDNLRMILNELSIRLVKYVDLHEIEYVKSLMLSSIEDYNNLLLPSEVFDLRLNNINNLYGFKIPESLKYLRVGKRLSLRGIEVPNYLKIYVGWLQIHEKEKNELSIKSYVEDNPKKYIKSI